MAPGQDRSAAQAARGAVTDVYADGWMGCVSSYTRYATENNRAGRMRIVVVRATLRGAEMTGHATVAIGPIVIGDDKQPHLGKPTEVKRVRHPAARQNGARPAVRPVRASASRSTITPTFVPKELAPDASDNRELGAKVRYVFLPPRKAAHK